MIFGMFSCLSYLHVQNLTWILELLISIIALPAAHSICNYIIHRPTSHQNCSGQQQMLE